MLGSTESPNRDSMSSLSESFELLEGSLTALGGCLDWALVEGAGAREDDAAVVDLEAVFVQAARFLAVKGFPGVFLVCCLRAGGCEEVSGVRRSEGLVAGWSVRSGSVEEGCQT